MANSFYVGLNAHVVSSCLKLLKDVDVWLTMMQDVTSSILNTIKPLMLFVMKDSLKCLRPHVLQGKCCFGLTVFSRVDSKGCLFQLESCKSWSATGSMLRPVLFLVYANRLPKCVSCRIKMFLDDTSFFLRINCLTDIDVSQQNIDQIKSCDWQLCLNASKCKVMYIVRKIIVRIYKLASLEGIPDVAAVDECDLV